MTSPKLRKSLGPWAIDAVGALVLLMLTLGVYLGAVRPTLERRDAEATKRQEVEARRQELRRLSALLKQLENRSASVRKALAQTGLHLRGASEANRRLAEIAELATRSALKVDEIKPGKILGGEHFDVVPLGLNGSGRYAACVKFLHKLRAGFPDTALAALNLRATHAARHPILLFEFRLRWHVARADSSRSKIAASPVTGSAGSAGDNTDHKPMLGGQPAAEASWKGGETEASGSSVLRCLPGTCSSVFP